MHYRGSTLIFSPSDLVQFVKNPFVTWMDRLHLERPGAAEPDPTSEGERAVHATASKRELGVLEHLEAEGHDVCRIDSGLSPQEARARTSRALLEGRGLVYQAALQSVRFAGIADFLRRVERTSNLGAHAYEIWDAKLATRAKPTHLMQLCAYSEMLAEVQGVRPESVSVVLGTGERREFFLRDCYAYYEGVRDAFLRQQDGFDPSNPPEPMPEGKNDRWESRARAWREGRQHLSLVAGITRTQVQRLERADIGTVRDLAALGESHDETVRNPRVETDTQSRVETDGSGPAGMRVPRVSIATLRRLCHQAELQLRSKAGETPAFEVLDPAEWASDRTSAEDPRRGLRLLPPPSPGDVVFDIEGDPLVEGGLEYLFGVVYARSGSSDCDCGADVDRVPDAHDGGAGHRDVLSAADSGHRDASSAAGAGHRDASRAADTGSKPETTFCDWWAHDATAEKRSFEAFVDWLHAHWKEHSDFHVFHYAPYEVSALRRLAGRYGTREEDLDQLLRAEIFVDLYQVVRQGLRVGTPSYSLKYVERLYRPARGGEVTTAIDSVAVYERWLELRDGEDWQSSSLLREIRDYNRDDCESTWELLQWLRERQRESGLDYIAPTGFGESERSNENAKGRQSDANDLAVQLRDAIPEDEGERSREPDRWRVQELLSHLLEFHWREARPIFWALFDRHEMSDDELYHDLDCLARLRRTETPPRKDARSQIFEYGFDPLQDTKIRAGKRSYCYFAHDLSVKVRVESIDTKQGRIELRFGPKPLKQVGGEPPERLALIPDEYVGPGSIEDALLEIGREYAAFGRLSPALQTFLLREFPRLRGRQPGSSILPEDTDLLQGTTRAVLAMDETALCIQGPPGSGKTYTAAHVILTLLRQRSETTGRPIRVAVSANSHKAIQNLLACVIEEARSVGGTSVGDEARSTSGDRTDTGKESLHVAKISGDEDDSFFALEGVTRYSDLKDVSDGVALVGGTAWAFTRPESRGAFDYLFVDEAGQVSLANLVALSTCAHNVILLGDQMQLSQPTRGSHPGESGLSALDYLLQGQATIPGSLGIFLAETWRMRPELCRFVSDAIYEGRLRARPETSRRRLEVPPDGRRLTREAGLLFVPVIHEANTQGSDEEIHAIEELMEALLATRFYEDGRPERRLGWSDVLIVAPYNFQVHRLRERLGSQARVGTIDKFQGQQAPVSILSMCASSAESSPRGAGFLFDRHRLNVALSRAQCLAIVVGHPALAATPCGGVEALVRVNLFCRIVKEGCVPEQVGMSAPHL